jgi:P4 family phage/plasmid primase-like protien
LTDDCLDPEAVAAIFFWTQTTGGHIIERADVNDKKGTKHTEWQNEDDTAFTLDYYLDNLKRGLYYIGFSVRMGILNRGPYKGLYLNCIDFDTYEAFITWGEDYTLEIVAKWTRVDWHQNRARIHVFFISKTPLKNLARTEKNQIIEVYGGDRLICCYGTHIDGNPIEPFDTKEIAVIDNIKKLEIEARVKQVIPDYLAEDEDERYIEELEKPETIVPSGSVHHAVRTLLMSVYFRWTNGFAPDKMSDEQRFQYVVDWDKQKAIQAKRPAYIDASPKKLQDLWEGIKKKYQKKRQEERDKRKREAENDSKRSNKKEASGDSSVGGTATAAVGGLDDEKPDIIEQAVEEIMSRHEFLTIEESKQVLYYRNGVYVPGGEVLIEKIAEATFDYAITNRDLSEIKGHIIRRTYHKHAEIDADIDIINLNNGLYNIQTGEFKEHSPDYLSINQIPVTYNPEAKPKRFGKFIHEVLYPSEIRTAIELLAYTFYRDNPFEIITILHGYGANGKSVLTGLLTALHGAKNVSNVPLAAMLEDRFALSDLENKAVNIDTELTSTTIKDTSILKKLTGRQEIRIQRKHERAYDAILYAKLFFSANKIPVAYDESDAFYRREMVVCLPNKFEGKGDDPDLKRKLTTQEELSGVFNVMMAVLRRVLKQNRIYTKERTIEQRRERYVRAADPITALLEAVIAEDSVVSDEVTKEKFHQAYLRFCNKHNLAVLSKESLSKVLKKKGFQDGRQTTGKRERIWKGVKLKEEYNVDITKQETLDVGAAAA